MALSRPRVPRRKLVLRAAFAAAAGVYVFTGLYPWRWSPPRRLPNHAERAGEVLRFGAPGIALGEGEDAWVAEARGRAELLIFLQVRSLSPRQEGPARIFTLSRDNSHRNLTLGQAGSDLVLRLRTPETTLNGSPERRVAGVFATSSWRRIELSAGEGLLRLGIDGRETLRQALPPRALEVWDTSHGLALGNEHTGQRPWLGEIREAKVRSGSVEVDHAAPGGARLPASYWAFNRPLLVPFRDLAWRGDRDRLLDAALNFIGFVPIAALAFFTMQSRVLAWAACAAVSLGLEGAQVFFAERFPSATDFVLNAAGVALAVSVLSYTWPCRNRVG